jgi:hypothetical protein
MCGPSWDKDVAAGSAFRVMIEQLLRLLVGRGAAVVRAKDAFTRQTMSVTFTNSIPSTAMWSRWRVALCSPVGSSAPRLPSAGLANSIASAPGGETHGAGRGLGGGQDLITRS